MAQRRRTFLLDLLLWAALAAPIVWALGTPPCRPFDEVLLVVEPLLLGVAVAVGRRWPLVSLILVVVPTMRDGNFLFAIPVMSYLTGLRMARARPAVLVFTVIGVGGSALNLWAFRSGLATWFLLATMLLFAGVFPWLLGRYRRQQGELVRAGWAQAELLEREQAGVAERVRMRERARIAQDMHDSLGHDLSLIALRAGALELAPGLDDRHRLAAGELRASVGAATDRLREIIGLLREDAGTAPTRPADEGVAELVDRAGAAGMAVRLRWREQSGPLPAEELPLLVGRAVHRVVQEALTNAARYAPGAPVTVEVDRTTEWIGVRIRNAPAPAGPLPVPVSAGTGLLGLRERVRLAGGTLTAGPGAGGFEVTARIPLVADPLAGDSLVEDPRVGDSLVGDRDASAPAAVRSASADRLRVQRRQVRRSLTVAVTAPVAIAAMLSLVYYPFVTFDSVLHRTEFERLRVGASRTELTRVLPGRQARGLAENAPSAPTGAECEFYTDGNFPLALPAYRLCFVDGRLVAKDELPG
ncbi:signal transduction histidine kinase [Micromonospora pisi]|uniref:histidine kinase n=1 Tax=Micromonospora pisi TaxID=589240 RepID=A0A495JRL6_9ACTN|nr:signal transduction histidine kinase [Micromonospora pisi]